ncbi:hypothetical protein K450DRAFT_256161 [Umbelopsis ramanniana AG]|uniref:UBZ4-type domain-containing protein n=1 Tax=Umbelopsis ramanniana AG TaxID=1314678 RepID=A0AAD5E6G7_UMBRA|nr:uncharacterized protein K450DRAFT_256161 [Umbelopsis ramanniana AG]KAI8576550.1 hypothetical protein K450DRAFT_256161 [Umbelopsis ramanniana AG]
METPSTLETDRSSEQVLCPICNTQFENLDNRMINEHIDSCLNMSLVRNEMKVSGIAPNDNGSASHESPSIQSRKDNQAASSKSLRDYFGSSNHT